MRQFVSPSGRDPGACKKRPAERSTAPADWTRPLIDVSVLSGPSKAKGSSSKSELCRKMKTCSENPDYFELC